MLHWFANNCYDQTGERDREETHVSGQFEVVSVGERPEALQ